MRDDARFWPLLTDLASCLASEIEASGLPDTCFTGVLPGEVVALDYCSECDNGVCGMAWVRLASLSESLSGSADAVVTNPCVSTLQATIEVGITRCAPSPADDGTPPTMADQLDAARLMMADQAAALRAIRCCKTSQRLTAIGQWTPMGPMGGCVGGTWSVTFEEAF